ncbi:MAG: hypothetical protein ACOCZU_05290 [Planctomycetota bacterium]
MSITDVELEELVEGEADVSEVDNDRIRMAVEGHRALRRRIREAFDSQRPGIGLFVRVQSAVSAAGVNPPREHGEIVLRFPRWGVVASAAAMVLLVLSAAYLLAPEPKAAPVSAGQGKIAQAVLAHIHTETSSHPTHPSSDWSDVRGYLAEQTGIRPRKISGSSLRLVGGSRTEFMGESAASYVFQTPEGPLTVVIMRTSPEKLNFDHCRPVDAGRLWACGFRDSRMVAVRVGDLTYCAIGKFDHDRLSELLRPLMTPSSPRASR